jgi:hypothetical protein
MAAEAGAGLRKKATLPMSMQPENPYPKGSPQRTLFGMFVSWFYFSRGSFPNNSANETGAVPLSRFLSTATGRKFFAANPTLATPNSIREVLGSAFEVTGDDLKIRALPHAHSLTGLGGFRNGNVSRRRRNRLAKRTRKN